MKLNKFYPYVLFLIMTAFGAACSNAPTTINNTNSNQAVVINSNTANTIPTNTVGSPAPNASPVATTSGSPSATVAAYYQSMVKKDEMAFRQVLSTATLKEFSAQAKEDGEKTLVGWFTGYSAPPKKTYETRSERISGDTALIETRDSETGLWSWTQLVRENGEWKMDLTNSTAQKMLDINKIPAPKKNK
ncbi:MAG: hypothetical protein ABI954_03795 [Pyrinomonadaceae bacterium]